MKREIHLALGRQGCGKTTRLRVAVARRLVEHEREGSAPLTIIHDVRCGAPGRWDPMAIGSLAPERARFKTCADALAVARERGRWPGRVFTVYQEDALSVFGVAWARANSSGAPSIVVVDELDQLPERLYRAKPDHTPCFSCLHYGRPYPVDIYGTTRLPQKCDSAWFAQATRVSLFALDGALQLDKIRASGWPGADRLVTDLPCLKPFTFIELDRPGG